MPLGSLRSWPTSAWLAVVVLLTVLGLLVQARSAPDTVEAVPAAATTTTTAPVVATTAPVGPATTDPDPTVTTGPTVTTAPPVATTPSPSPTTAAPTTGNDQLERRLAGLRVAWPDPALPDYRRDAFGSGWDYDPASGCNVRERVLIEESLDPAVVGDRCAVLSGRWVSLYDGVVATSPADLQIDHFVPLAEAWRSGAATWTPQRRQAFANDLTDPDSLIAVTGSSNGSKSDSGPHEWLPPDRSAWCTYADMWVDSKARWELSITPVERDALVGVLADC